MELVSVVMGVYNNLDTIERAVASIFAQDYPYLELIVCDDASTDGSAEWLEEYQMAHPSHAMTLFRNSQNMGLAHALNRCLEQCSGTFVARMDADDEALPERISTQIAFLQTHAEYDLVGCCMKVVNDCGTIRVRGKSGEATAKELQLGVPFAHPTIVARRHVYDTLNGYCESERTLLCEDTEFWFRFFSAGFRGFNLPQALYIKRETIADYKKRTVRRALRSIGVRRRGFGLLDFPWYVYPLLIKPLLAALIPHRIMMWLHTHIF